MTTPNLMGYQGYTDRTRIIIGDGMVDNLLTSHVGTPMTPSRNEVIASFAEGTPDDVGAAVSRYAGNLVTATQYWHQSMHQLYAPRMTDALRTTLEEPKFLIGGIQRICTAERASRLMTAEDQFAKQHGLRRMVRPGSFKSDRVFKGGFLDGMARNLEVRPSGFWREAVSQISQASQTKLRQQGALAYAATSRPDALLPTAIDQIIPDQTYEEFTAYRAAALARRK